MTIHEHIAKTLGICAAATGGEWFDRKCGDVTSSAGQTVCDFVPYASDRALIVHARTMLPRFAKALEVAMQRIERTSDWDDAEESKAQITSALEGTDAAE